MGKLYVVPTPVGNLEDITLRAIRVLKEADLILAEDTRTSSVLFKKYDIHTKTESHHKFNEHKSSAAVCEKILSGMWRSYPMQVLREYRTRVFFL